MPLKIVKSKTGGTFTPAPAGQHVAVCKGVVDLGLQDGPYGMKPKVYILWQLPNVPVKWKGDDGKERDGFAEVGAFYTNSDNEKAKLRLMLEAWRAKAFSEAEIEKGIDLFSVIGKACQLTITHNSKGDRTYANVTAVAPLLAGMTAPPLSGDPLIYNREDGKGFEKLPKFLQGKIRPSEVSAQGAGQSASGPDDSDIPF